MTIDRKRGGSKLSTPNERALADAVSRARTAKPPRDQRWYVAANELAMKLGLDTADVIERFDEVAAIYEYEANTTRVDAEARAWRDVEERLTKQKAMPLP